MTFKEWMEEVDRAIARTVLGVTSLDLADQPFRDWFDDGMSAAEAATLTLQDEGWY